MTGLWDIALSLASESWVFVMVAALSCVAGFLFGALLVAVATISGTAEEWRRGWDAGYSEGLRRLNERDPMVSIYLELKKLAEEGLEASTKDAQRDALKSILERVNAALDTQKDWKKKNG